MSGRTNPVYWLRRAVRALLRPVVLDIVNSDVRVWGDRSRLKLDPSARMVNTLFNLAAGTIAVGEYTFAGHNVSIITGTHEYTLLLQQRMCDIPRHGRDIHIGKGVWIGSNAVILGPCRIGDHAVIAAGAIVTSDVEPFTIVAGVPAKPIRRIESASRC
jgi:acetyltransferase-like isoleucine patch superfamily enzyme